MAETTNPKYYRRGSIETWDFIRDQGLNFHLGNAVKYICRAGYKNSTEEDLEKAIVYLQNEITNVKRKNLPRHDSSDSIVFTGSGIPGGVSDRELDSPFSSYSSKESYNGGVQGVFGCGGDVISFGSELQTGLSEGTS